MKKIFDSFDLLLASTAGVLLTMVTSAMIYALGAPRIILVAVMAIMAVVMTAITAYSKGVQRGREIARKSEHKQLSD